MVKRIGDDDTNIFISKNNVPIEIVLEHFFMYQELVLERNEELSGKALSHLLSN